MKQYLNVDQWNIIEEGFNPDNHEISESVFSIGNGYMGQRANFEERYSGKSLQGSYVAGVYYPDKTRVGWWKNGYPEYFAKVLNSTNWIGINVKINDEVLDIAKCEIRDFKRILNMKEGYLKRRFIAKLPSDNEISVESIRFISMNRASIGVIKYSVKALNFEGKISFNSYLDGDIMNKDSNYDEKFWNPITESVQNGAGHVMMKTKKLDFQICSYMQLDLCKNESSIDFESKKSKKEKYISNDISIDVLKNDKVTLYKYVSTTSSRYYNSEDLIDVTKKESLDAKNTGFETLLMEQKNAWAIKWKESDIIINGDISAQQAIRFNIFQLNQTYNGEDSRLNIGPKGFTGEKYGGSTYWDTEAYCLPFYLSTAEEQVSKNLLIYRYNQLSKAIENAQKLGFNSGAALYPMVTMNGEECHNEWEITFEEIHRNGAIAYAIFNYVNYTGDKSYLTDYGLEVLIAISRFWAQRVNFSKVKNKYVILGVTGPNEYENNVNNNWYTNKMASWTLEYTTDVIKFIKTNFNDKYTSVLAKINFNDNEIDNWNDIIKNMYYPYDEEQGVFLQQDNYLDKEQIMVKDLDPINLPINQNWSWDRILRSCFIKQADVLQGLYTLEDSYDKETIEKNFNFYEPRTVHESSLSPCIHAVLAAKIGNFQKAYEMYLRTSRLDLDNYNNDTEDGCHSTSMAGTWIAVVQGFGGFRVKNDKVVLNPFIPSHWDSYSFKIMFRTALLNISVTNNEILISNEKDSSVALCIYKKDYSLNGKSELTIKR